MCSSFSGAEEVAQPGEALVVLRHGHEEEILRPRGIGEFVEAGLGDGAGHLARAVGAEIEEDHGIVVADAATGGAAGLAPVVITTGSDEFVGHALLVALAHGLDGIGRARASASPCTTAR